MRALDRHRLDAQLEKETQLFFNQHPASRQLYDRARQHWQGGVPMIWMVRWAGSFPIFVTQAQGAHFKGVDNRSTLISAWAIPAP